MPCQSYESNWANRSNDADIKRLKKEADKLARIACTALQALEDMGKEDFVLLKNDEIRKWWQEHKEADRQAQEEARRKEARKAAKERALSKLTDEEKVILGLKKA
jgi:ABC-type cobalamin/Fe3+-siderophores transport system ATPase subunit